MHSGAQVKQEAQSKPLESQVATGGLQLVTGGFQKVTFSLQVVNWGHQVVK